MRCGRARWPLGAARRRCRSSSVRTAGAGCVPCHPQCLLSVVLRRHFSAVASQGSPEPGGSSRPQVGLGVESQLCPVPGCDSCHSGVTGAICRAVGGRRASSPVRGPLEARSVGHCCCRGLPLQHEGQRLKGSHHGKQATTGGGCAPHGPTAAFHAHGQGSHARTWVPSGVA